MASNIKDILGYEGLYSITNDGRVFSTQSNRFLSNKPQFMRGMPWYKGYVLVKNGVKESVSGHVLVANAFISNPSNKPQVNHIDGNKQNNHVSNLEWCTVSENIQHAFDTGLKVHQVPLHVSQENGKKLGLFQKANAIISEDEWSEIAEAISNGVSGAAVARHFGIARSWINKKMRDFDVKRGDRLCQAA